MRPFLCIITSKEEMADSPHLPEELAAHVLSHVPLTDLASCARLSQVVRSLLGVAGDHYIYRQLLSQFRNPTPPFDDKVNWAGLVSAYLHKLGDDQHKRKLYRAITRGSIAQAQKALVAGGGPWTVDRGHKTWANARAMHGMTERATQLRPHLQAI